jgi:TP901 family phage tail tape measure protein
MALSLEQLQQELRKAAENATYFKKELMEASQQANSLGVGSNINEITKALQKAGEVGAETFTTLKRGASDTLMQMNDLEGALRRYTQLEQEQSIKSQELENAQIARAQELAAGIKERAQQTQKLYQLEASQPRTEAYEQELAALRKQEKELERIQDLVNKGPYSSGGVGAGGAEFPPTARSITERAPEPFALATQGFVTPLSPGITSNQDDLVKAAERAKQAIYDTYNTGSDQVEKFNAYVEQATGNVVVQAQVVRDLGHGMTQTFTATQTSSPFTGKTSSYSAGQQAFIDQSGGLERANQMLSEYGMTVNNVTGYYKELGSNVSRFSVTASDGISTAMGEMDQFGNATLKSSRNAQTFFENVGRNVGKVIEWAAATGLVYAAMNSVFQASGQLVDIQDKMADIAIATGKAGEELTTYYEAAQKVANLTGVDVSDTIEAEARAYRAAAGESDRFNTSTILLRDSLILAKLSGMDQAKSLDTMVAALRQSGMSLQQGTALLDKWVKTTQNAGVSMEDLAQSFAITSEVAGEVGVDVDHLNGIIATLAEKTTLSSTEVGNAVRTMFANITSDAAVKALGDVGVAVKDVNGNMRSWLDITQNIVDLMNSGLLSSDQVNKLADALGGGSRRGPQVLALWKNFAEVNRVAADSSTANGDAAAAMGTKLDTLKTALTELQNALTDLVHTLGYNGGFLDLIMDGVKFVTDLVKSINELAESFGNGASSIAVFAAGFAALSRVMGGVNPIAGGLKSIGANGLGNFLGQTPQAGSWQAGAQGLVGPGLAIAGGEIARGIANNESIDRVGVRVGATMAGAFVGNMIIPGAGGAIGGFIADAFVNSVQQKEDAIRDLTTGGAKTPGALQKDILSGYFQGSNSVLGGRPDLLRSTSDEDLIRLFNKAATSGVLQQANKQAEPARREQIFEKAGYNASQAKILSTIGFQDQFSSSKIQEFIQFSNQYIAALDDQKKALQETAPAIPLVTRNIENIYRNPNLGGALSASFQSQSADLARTGARTGNTGDYTKQTTAMQQILSVAPQVAVALGRVNISKDEYIKLGNDLLHTTDEERTQIIQYTTSIIDLKAKIEELNKAGRGGYNQNLVEATGELNKQQAILDQILQTSKEAYGVRYARENYKSFTQGPTDQNGKPVTSQQAGFQDALKQAQADQSAYAKYLGLDPEALKASVTDPLVLAFADGYQTVTGLTSDFSKELMDKMKETTDSLKNQMGFTFRDLHDIPASMYGALATSAKRYEQFLNKNYGPYGYDEKSQNVGLLFKDNQAKTLNTTMTALNLAIQDLTEVEKKQLEGQWNLPSGATAYVPITSLFYSQSKGGGGPPMGGTGNANQLQGSVDKLKQTVDVITQNLHQPNDERRYNDIIRNTPADERRYNDVISTPTTTAPAPINVGVQVTPQSIVLTMDGKVIANIIAPYLAQGFGTQASSGAGGTGTGGAGTGSRTFAI